MLPTSAILKVTAGAVETEKYSSTALELKKKKNVMKRPWSVG